MYSRHTVKVVHDLLPLNPSFQPHLFGSHHRFTLRRIKAVTGRRDIFINLVHDPHWLQKVYGRL